MSESQEDSPLLRTLSEKSVNRIWFVSGVASLVIAWCVLDSWNHDTTSHIFGQSEVKAQIPNPFTGETLTQLDPFNFTLTLAFLQFVFTGLFFSSIFAVRNASAGASVAESLGQVRASMSDGRWPALVGTHMFGSVLIQSLIMPSQMMSLGFFAATRAVEIPVAAGVRAKMFGTCFGGHAPLTTGLAFAAAWLLFFSYSQISECLCVWSGFGVALTGMPLYFVYALLLTIPATNIVLQESVLLQLEVNPILMQSIQNICAALLFVPVLVGAQWLGYEDVKHGIGMISRHPELYMAIFWLCLQTAVLSAITVSLIMMVDSFWTVGARSLRVVFWWVRQLPLFYAASGTLLSVAHPHASIWSFAMLGGVFLGLCAVVTDSRPSEETCQGKASCKPAEGIFGTSGLSVGKYV